MEVLTASVGVCLGITRAYRGMNKRALAEAPFAVTHQGAGGEFDTLSRIERREAYWPIILACASFRLCATCQRWAPATAWCSGFTDSTRRRRRAWPRAASICSTI